jgi:hypothetical protein
MGLPTIGKRFAHIIRTRSPAGEQNRDIDDFSPRHLQHLAVIRTAQVHPEQT